jgi:hypothetical protein
MVASDSPLFQYLIDQSLLTFVHTKLAELERLLIGMLVIDT